MTPARPTTGSVLAERYRLTGHLGRDGAAEVFRADDLALARTVTVTLLPPPETGPAPYSEADLQLRAGLAHPGLAAVLDRGAAAGHPYVVTEVTPGESLADRLARGPLTTGETVRVGAALADTLAHLHAERVTHGDVAADRVVLADDGRVVLHGLVTGPVSAPVSPPDHRAPELLWRWQASPPGDVYTLGALLTACVTGVTAHGEAAPAGPEAGLQRPWEASAAAAPEPLAELLVPMTRTDPALRPRADEVASRLGRHGGPESGTSPLPAYPGAHTAAAYAPGGRTDRPTGPMPASPLQDDLAARTGVAHGGALAGLAARLRALPPWDRRRSPLNTAVAAVLGVALLATVGVLTLVGPGATPTARTPAPAPAPTESAGGGATTPGTTSPEATGTRTDGPAATATRTAGPPPSPGTGAPSSAGAGTGGSGPDAGTRTSAPPRDAPDEADDTASPAPSPTESGGDRGRSDDAPGRGLGHDKDHPGPGGG
jgi:eukaryotic-like serine/threonine-protein kinase